MMEGSGVGTPGSDGSSAVVQSLLEMELGAERARTRGFAAPAFAGCAFARGQGTEGPRQSQVGFNSLHATVRVAFPRGVALKTTAVDEPR
jgi:hypothetical protein